MDYSITGRNRHLSSSWANMVFDFQENADALNNSFFLFYGKPRVALVARCVCMDNIDWDQQVEKQLDKTPSTIDLLNTTQCQELGIDGRKIDVCKQKIEQAKSEVAAEAEVDHLQKELEEEFEKERLLQEELR
ncbi:hypothetical protein Q3G72_012590 [Acer saccharum]|nr:hypothetical protein Q3G72_012590 [Acer saccharum]